ncbi:hypothetical protein [Actinomycetospora termitidis]|uniref:Uncharacterized protein n=1 Tax=Actinomycetospora termitidis TaxID=3053470 RepID=A0ABT7MF26_9PSEU|nr:hypothetical protein [Actinomycetospora sp. Odt1-22]MDL5159270.1 hypothetical protein [Actinomycetospora sp. Odt1-22]
MSRDELRVKERAVLLTLLAEGRELTNAQMQEAGGVRLDGEERRRLNDRKLVTSTRVGRGYSHELTDDGVAWCTAELTGRRPVRSGTLGGALYAILRALGRTGTPLAELFPYRPEVAAAPTDTATAPVDSVREAYDRLAAPGEWVGLDRLRAEVNGLAREAVDAALLDLAERPGVHLQEEPNRKALQDRHRDAAIVLGGLERHMIMIEGR